MDVIQSRFGNCPVILPTVTWIMNRRGIKSAFANLLH